VGHVLEAGSLILICLHPSLPSSGVSKWWWPCAFPHRVFEAPTLALCDGSLADSSLGHRVEIGIARIGMSPSNLRMGEIKLSKACIQIHWELDLREKY
jgi:hypothetical protein